MGYRSNVYIKVNKIDEKKLTNLLIKNNFEATKEFEDDNSVGYTINDVKWYNNYKEVEAINSFIDEDCEHPRGMIVIGEDNDKDEYGKPWEIGLFVITQISWN